MPQNPQNKIDKTELNHYNKLRSLITEALGQVQITIYKGMKLKAETLAKERDQ